MKKLSLSHYFMIIICILALGSLGYTLIFNKLSFVNGLLCTLESIAFMLIAILPQIINAKTKYYISDLLYITIVMYAFFGTIAGDVLDFFDKFIWFDSALHLFSGIILAVVAFSVANTIIERNQRKATAVFISCYALFFAVSLGAIWEIYEYVVDHSFNSNMQTYMTESTSSFKKKGDVPLTGHDAISDTMEDIILNTTGGLVTCVYGYFSIRRNLDNYGTASLIKKKS